MAGKTIIDGTSPKTQSIEAVKALLTWKGRASDPLPSVVEFANEGEENRLVLVLSNKKNSYYVATATKCSCPSATYRPGQPCKHQRRHFGAKLEQAATVSDTDRIRPTGGWAGGFNGPVDSTEIPGLA